MSLSHLRRMTKTIELLELIGSAKKDVVGQ